MAGNTFELDAASLERLQRAMQEYQGETETAINDVLHNEAGTVLQEKIYTLMPFSGKTWKGKKPPAKTSRSLMNVEGNLSITVKTNKNYQYLYFPDDGSTTRRHVGNQQFFYRSGVAVQDIIVDRCINRLVTDFDKGV